MSCIWYIGVPFHNPSSSPLCWNINLKHLPRFLLSCIFSLLICRTLTDGYCAFIYYRFPLVKSAHKTPRVDPFWKQIFNYIFNSSMIVKLFMVSTPKKSLVLFSLKADLLSFGSFYFSLRKLLIAFSFLSPYSLCPAVPTERMNFCPCSPCGEFWGWGVVLLCPPLTSSNC